MLLACYQVAFHPKSALTELGAINIMTDPRYLSDPEEENEPWFESIQANTRQEAEDSCKDLANEYEVELTEVRDNGDKNYDCYFQ